jgi:hypothetical protein
MTTRKRPEGLFYVAQPGLSLASSLYMYLNSVQVVSTRMRCALPKDSKSSGTPKKWVLVLDISKKKATTKW